MTAKELHINIKPSLSDLSAIKKWLDDEIEKSGEGFNNWNVVEKAFNNDSLITLSYQSAQIGFVAFCKHEIYVDFEIFAIEPKHRRKGIGKIFYKKIAEYFKLNDCLALKLFCEPASSERFWKQMGFTKFPPLGDGHHELTYYKPLIKTQETSTEESHRNVLELWNLEPYQTKNILPTWTWDLNMVDNHPTLSIIQPCNDNWKLRWMKNGETLHEDKVKRFVFKEKVIHFPPFLYIASLERDFHIKK